MKLNWIKSTLTVAAALALATNLSAQRHGPAAAAEQAKQLIPHPVLEATLFASEPMLVNPANMDIDAEGRVWVTEGANYRLFKPWGKIKPEGDRIRILEDTDGDAVVFKRRPDGKLDYHVNGTLKVEQLTSLVQRGGTLHLDGRSAGSWGSARVTTPSSFDDAMAAIALYEADRSGDAGGDATPLERDATLRLHGVVRVVRDRDLFGATKQIVQRLQHHHVRIEHEALRVIAEQPPYPQLVSRRHAGQQRGGKDKPRARALEHAALEERHPHVRSEKHDEVSPAPPLHAAQGAQQNQDQLRRPQHALAVQHVARSEHRRNDVGVGAVLRGHGEHRLVHVRVEGRALLRLDALGAEEALPGVAANHNSPPAVESPPDAPPKNFNRGRRNQIMGAAVPPVADDWRAPVFSKTPEEEAALRQLLKNHVLLQGTKDADIDIVLLATPHMERLSDATGEGCKLSILNEGGVVVIAASPGTRGLALAGVPGQRLPDLE